MTFDHTQLGDVHVITPKKNLVGKNETQDLIAKVDEIAAAGNPRIIVDLGKISYVNSTGLGALVRARTTCVNRQGWFRVARVGDRIGAIFMVTKLVLIFDTFETVEEAVAGPPATS
jgi:anti-sigma B factor antagonist